MHFFDVNLSPNSCIHKHGIVTKNILIKLSSVLTFDLSDFVFICGNTRVGYIHELFQVSRIYTALGSSLLISQIYLPDCHSTCP